MHCRTWTLPPGSALVALLIAGVALLAPLAARAADVHYTMQPLAALGGMGGDVPISEGLTWLS
jgi:hypothetical protein